MSGEKWSIRPALEEWARHEEERYRRRVLRGQEPMPKWGSADDLKLRYGSPPVEPPEPPDEWETENQSAMIEAVRRKKP